MRRESSADSHLDAIVTVDLDVIECSDSHSVLPWMGSPFRRLKVLVVEEQKLEAVFSFHSKQVFRTRSIRLSFLFPFFLSSLLSSSS